MSPKEFQALDNNLVAELKKKLTDSDIVVKNEPFGGKLIGISYEKGGSLFEIYQLHNDGNVASWKFAGTGNLR